mgnify:CR=1 FL=1
MNREKVINLRELLHYVLKKWRAIIVIAIVFAILAGAYKINSISGTADNTQTSEEVADRMLLTSQLNDLKEDLNSQIEYNQDSIYMKIDPRNEHIATFNLFVSVDESGLSEEQIALLTSKTVMAYYGYLYSNEFLDYLSENVEDYKGFDDDLRYIKELMWASTELEAGELAYTCIGVSDETVQATIDAARQAIAEKYDDIAELVGEHKCSVAFDSVYTTTSSSVLKSQNDNLELIDDYKEAIEEVSAELDGMKPAAQSEALSTSQIIVKALKFAVIGGVLGLILAVACYIIAGILSHKMYDVCSWQGCGIPVIGEVYTEKKHRAGAKIDRWIDKITGYAVNGLTLESSGALAAENVIASLRENKAEAAAIISAENKELCSAVVAGMNNVSADTFKFAGDILTESNAVSALAEIEEVILLADGQKIRIDDVEKIATRLTAWGKKLLGVILIK